MRLKFIRAIGVALHIGAIGKTFAEQRMHDAAGERAIGARPQDDLDVGLLHGVVVVDVDGGDLAGADGKANAGDVGADGRVEAGIFLHMREPVDAIAHHHAHGAGIVIGPYRFRAELALGLIKSRHYFVEREFGAESVWPYYYAGTM